MSYICQQRTYGVCVTGEPMETLELAFNSMIDYLDGGAVDEDSLNFYEVEPIQVRMEKVFKIVPKAVKPKGKLPV